MIELIFKIIACHMIGDYVLQTDFIAKTKGTNWYHLFVHSILYVLPFYMVFGFNIELAILFMHHFVVDTGKARLGKFTYLQDQVFHYLMLTMYLA